MEPTKWRNGQMNAVRLWNLWERTMASAILHITSLFSLTKSTSLVSSIPFRNRHNLRNRIPKPKVPSSSRNGNNNLPETECPVPFEQQPINEYQTLSTSFPFSWASADIVEYCSRLFVIGASFALFIGLPVAWFGAAGANSEPLKRFLCAVSSGIFVVTLAVLRMYLGWAYVGNRLLSATVECKLSLLLAGEELYIYNVLYPKNFCGIIYVSITHISFILLVVLIFDCSNWDGDYSLETMNKWKLFVLLEPTIVYPWQKTTKTICNGALNNP